MRKVLAIASMAIVLAGGGATTVLADAVTDCAKIQGKALGALLVALAKEAGRACGNGSAGNPLEVSQGAAASAAGKFFSKVGKSVDKIGAGSCAITLDTLDQPALNADLDSILSSMRGLADSACLVP